MKIARLIYIFFFPLFLFPSLSVAKANKIRLPDKPPVADSILANIIFFAPFYEKIVDRYEADLYIKGKLNVIKRNHLLRIVPSMFKMNKHVKEYIIESVNEIHYTAPDIYDMKVKAISGTVDRYRGISNNMLEYFNINVYSSTLLSDKLLSPLAKNGKKYYYYLLDSVMGSGRDMRYKILIIPKNKSSQLVKGYMTVRDQTWTINEIALEGKSDLVRFNLKMEMGQTGKEEFLPEKVEVGILFKFLGNKMQGNYAAFLKYKDISLNDIKRKMEKAKNKYNLTESFRLTLDSTALLTDSAKFASLRPYPLSEHELKIYQDYTFRKDTTSLSVKHKKKSRVFFGQLGDVLLSSYTVNLSQLGSVRCSPLINPFLISYSHSNGFSYRQEFKYNRLFSGDRLLRIVPRIGYNFTRKEFYWNINSDYDYWPSKQGTVHVGMGNGNRIYSSRILDAIKELPDSVFNFDQIHLDVFKDLYFTIDHSIEIVNGWKVNVGFTTHRRTSIEKSKIVALSPPTYGQLSIVNNLRGTYISFAPRVRTEWTPGMYYYMNGKRKINLYSKFPTFSLDWERGIKGVFKSTGEYERWELDVQQQIHLGLMRNLYWRAGGGMFTNQKEMYFVDFANFSRSNLPEGWNDDIGGVFQLLDGHWYNSVRKYIRAHVTYEAPFLLLRHLIKYTSSVLNERIYFNFLIAPNLAPYMEVGYGIGTHVFDLGVFMGNRKGKFDGIGCKFTFELFNK